MVARIFVIALVARLLFVVWLNFAPQEFRPVFAVVTPDSQGYLALARGLMEGEGYHFGGDHLEPTRIPPLFPLWLSLVGHLSLSPAFIGLTNALLGALTTVLLYRLALYVAGQRVALAAAGLYALYPHVLLSTTCVLKEPLSTFLLVAFSLGWAHTLKRSHRLSSSLWGYSSLAGFLLGLSVLSRYLHLGLVCMLLATHALLLVVAPAFKLSRKSLAASALVATTIAFVTLSPWLYRNYLLTGELVLSSHGPMRYLYNSNSTLARPETWGYYEAKTVGGEEWEERARELAEQLGSPVPQDDPDRLLHPIIVAEDDSFTTREQKFAKAAALSTRNHPEHVLSLVWGKLINTWRPVWAGSSKLTWLAVGVPHILLMLLALPGAWIAGRRVWRERDAALFVPLMIVAFYFLAHAVFYGMIRSRLYAIPFLCLLAAFSLWGRVKNE